MRWPKWRKKSLAMMIDRAGMVAEADVGAGKAGEIVDGAAVAKEYEVSQASKIAQEKQEAVLLPAAFGASNSTKAMMIDCAGMVAEVDAGAGKACEIVDGAVVAKKEEYVVTEASKIAQEKQEAALLPAASGASTFTKALIVADERQAALETRIELVEAKLEAIMKASHARHPVDAMAQTFVAPPCDADVKRMVLRYVGTCDGDSGQKGIAIYIGIPGDHLTDSPQPTGIVVGYEKGCAWKEGQGVTMVLDGETIAGEPRVSKVPLDRFRTNEAFFVRLGGVEGVELRAGIIDKIYVPEKVAGHVAGVRVGDAIFRWDETRQLLVSGLVCSTDDGDAVFGVSVHGMTTSCLEFDKKAWYRTKYPHRRLRRANYGYT